jgi:hypothetical protein
MTAKTLATGVLSSGMLALFAIGCSKSSGPELDKLTSVSAGKLSFSYPSNWRAKLVQDKKNGKRRLRSYRVRVSPSATAVVQLFEPAVELDVKLYAAKFLRGFRKALAEKTLGLLSSEGVVHKRITRRFVGRDRAGLRIKLELKLIAEQTPSTVDLDIAKLSHATIVLVALAADKDFDTINHGFNAIRKSVSYTR